MSSPSLVVPGSVVRSVVPSDKRAGPEMTLNLTLLTSRTIYQSADFRLTNMDTGEVVSDTSSKLITLRYESWDGLVSYTSAGRWQGRDTLEYVIECLTGLQEATPGDVAWRIQESGNEWLRNIERTWRRVRQTFILATFEAARARLDMVSNFENCIGQMEPRTGSSLSVSTASR